MAKFNWNEVTAEDVVTAISIFESEKPEYTKARSAFLLYNGKKYPAKYIRGMAYKVHFGQEISKTDYAGGIETVRFFSRLGFETQYVRQNVRPRSVRKYDLATVTRELMESEEFWRIQDLVFMSMMGEKITVPASGAVEQKKALQLLLNRIFDGDLVCGKTFPWMKTPSKITDEYESVIRALVAYRGDIHFVKKDVALPCDFVCESRKLIIEYDDRPHFTEARRL